MNATLETFKLDDLAREAGVSARTVRYYVQRGLLPAPVFRGKDTVYTGEHLSRLRAIKKLQDRFLPLDAIQAELERRTPSEIERLADEVDVAPPPPPPRPQPTPPPAGHPYRFPGHVWRPEPAEESLSRWVIAPGLELVLSAGASPATRRLAEDMIDHATNSNHNGGRK